MPISRQNTHLHWYIQFAWLIYGIIAILCSENYKSGYVEQIAYGAIYWQNSPSFGTVQFDIRAVAIEARFKVKTILFSISIRKKMERLWSRLWCFSCRLWRLQIFIQKFKFQSNSSASRFECWYSKCYTEARTKWRHGENQLFITFYYIKFGHFRNE